MDTKDLQETVLEAALPHVPFDGWSETTFQAAINDSGLNPALCRAVFPRGGVDLALTYHRRGDREMARKLAAPDAFTPEMRFRDKVVAAVMLRLSLVDPEAVRRGTALFSLPQYAGDGAKAIWGTVDQIWSSLGDTSDDINWYSKRASLAAIYGATVLYWLGDDSENHSATRDFLTRRVENLMGFEKAKAAVLANPLGKILTAAPRALLANVKAPRPSEGLPGQSRSPRPF